MRMIFASTIPVKMITTFQRSSQLIFRSLQDQYLTDLGLVLNPSKTKFILIHRPTSSVTICKPHLTCRMPASSSAKYLGLMIDENLTFRPQVEYVCDSIHRKLGAFKHGRRNLSHAAKRIFYLSVLQPTLDNASSGYCHCLSQTLYNRLTTCSHIPTKKTFGLDRSTPNKLVLRFCKLYPIELKYNLKQLKLLMLVYRAVNGQCSLLLTEMFQLTSASRAAYSKRGSSSSAVALPNVSTRHGLFSVSFLAADLLQSGAQICDVNFILGALSTLGALLDNIVQGGLEPVGFPMSFYSKRKTTTTRTTTTTTTNCKKLLKKICVLMLGCLEKNFCPSHPNCTPLLAYQLSWEVRINSAKISLMQAPEIVVCSSSISVCKQVTPHRLMYCCWGTISGV